MPPCFRLSGVKRQASVDPWPGWLDHSGAFESKVIGTQSMGMQGSCAELKSNYGQADGIFVKKRRWEVHFRRNIVRDADGMHDAGHAKPAPPAHGCQGANSASHVLAASGWTQRQDQQPPPEGDLLPATPDNIGLTTTTTTAAKR